MRLFILISLFSGISAIEYVFKHEYARLVYSNKSLIDIKTFDFYKANRTLGALNVTVVLKKDIVKNEDLKIEVKAFIFRNNEYINSAIAWDVYLCDILKSGQYDMRNIIVYSDITACPIYKDQLHYLKKISPSSEGWPPLIPQGKYMITLSFIMQNEVGCKVQWMTNTIDKKNLHV